MVSMEETDVSIRTPEETYSSLLSTECKSLSSVSSLLTTIDYSSIGSHYERPENCEYYGPGADLRKVWSRSESFFEENARRPRRRPQANRDSEPDEEHSSGLSVIEGKKMNGAGDQPHQQHTTSMPSELPLFKKMQHTVMDNRKPTPFASVAMPVYRIRAEKREADLFVASYTSIVKLHRGRPKRAKWTPPSLVPQQSILHFYGQRYRNGRPILDHKQVPLQDFVVVDKPKQTEIHRGLFPPSRHQVPSIPQHLHRAPSSGATTDSSRTIRVAEQIEPAKKFMKSQKTIMDCIKEVYGDGHAMTSDSDDSSTATSFVRGRNIVKPHLMYIDNKKGNHDYISNGHQPLKSENTSSSGGCQSTCACGRSRNPQICRMAAGASPIYGDSPMVETEFCDGSCCRPDEMSFEKAENFVDIHNIGKPEYTPSVQTYPDDCACEAVVATPAATMQTTQKSEITSEQECTCASCVVENQKSPIPHDTTGTLRTPFPLYTNTQSAKSRVSAPANAMAVVNKLFGATPQPMEYPCQTDAPLDHPKEVRLEDDKTLVDVLMQSHIGQGDHIQQPSVHQSPKSEEHTDLHTAVSSIPKSTTLPSSTSVTLSCYATYQGDSDSCDTVVFGAALSENEEDEQLSGCGPGDDLSQLRNSVLPPPMHGMAFLSDESVYPAQLQFQTFPRATTSMESALSMAQVASQEHSRRSMSLIYHNSRAYITHSTSEESLEDETNSVASTSGDTIVSLPPRRCRSLVDVSTISEMFDTITLDGNLPPNETYDTDDRIFQYKGDTKLGESARIKFSGCMTYLFYKLFPLWWKSMSCRSRRACKDVEQTTVNEQVSA